MFIHNFIFTSLLMTSASVFAFSSADEKSKPETLPPVNDGPYIFVSKQKLNAYWLCQGQVLEQSFTPEDFPLDVNACNLPVKVHSFTSVKNKVFEFSGNFPVAALSDFHGQYDLMIKLLTNNKIIDNNKNWAFGKGHFVITGDIFDRGDKVTEILWFLYDLEQQAIKGRRKALTKF